MQKANTESIKNMLQAYLENAKEERKPENEFAAIKKDGQIILVRL